MMQDHHIQRYGSTAIFLHWLTLALLVGVYGAIELREFYPRGSALREGLKTWHYMLGLTMFGLVWVRVINSLLARAPDPVERGWRHALSRVTHLALYLLMISMPIAGWLILSGEGEAVPFFGLTLPPLTGKDGAFAESLKELHELGGTIGYWLIGLHAVAALFHQYILRDALFKRMLPHRL